MDFNNTEIAFRGKSKRDLRISYLLFFMVKYPFIVTLIKGVSILALSLRLPVKWILKPTLFKQFAGGESIMESQVVIKSLIERGVRSVLDYSSEGGGSENDIKRAFQETISAIDYASRNIEVPFAVFKPSSLVEESLFARAAKSLDPLSASDVSEFDKFRERFFSLCSYASQKKVKILIDAEYYSSQNIVDEFVQQVMLLYNKKEAIVFHTLQMYRKDRLDYLKYLIEDSKSNNYILGIKFVRGAYMEQERELAIERGYDDPIFESKELTDISFDSAIKLAFENLNTIEIFCGTHNYMSNTMLCNLIDSASLPRNFYKIWFSQLYGMSDNISYNLANAGFNVCKYLPYSPVREILPYLVRRAQENSSVSDQTSRELSLIKLELNRRAKQRK